MFLRIDGVTCEAQGDGPPEEEGGKSGGDQSFRTTLVLGGQLMFMEAGSVAVADRGATANLARSRWLEHRNEISGHKGYPRVPTRRVPAFQQLEQLHTHYPTRRVPTTARFPENLGPDTSPRRTPRS